MMATLQCFVLASSVTERSCQSISMCVRLQLFFLKENCYIYSFMIQTFPYSTLVKPRMPQRPASYLGFSLIYSLAVLALARSSVCYLLLFHGGGQAIMGSTYLLSLIGVCCYHRNRFCSGEL